MKALKLAAAIGLVVASHSASASLVLDFEGDVGPNPGRVTAHKGYVFTGSSGGESWVHSSGFGDILPTSGGFLAWSNGGAQLNFSGPTFTLSSAQLSARNGRCGGQSTVAQPVRGYSGGSEMASTTIDVGCTGQLAQYNFGTTFVGVDAIQFDNIGVNLVLDDLVLSDTGSGSVPVPYTLGLLGLGLLGLGLRRRA